MRIHVSAPLPNRLSAPSNMERSDILKATQKRDSSEQRESGAWRMTSEPGEGGGGGRGGKGGGEEGG